MLQLSDDVLFTYYGVKIDSFLGVHFIYESLKTSFFIFQRYQSMTANNQSLRNALYLISENALKPPTY